LAHSSRSRNIRCLRTALLILLAGAVLAAGSFVLGRATADDREPSADEYAAGLRAGRAAGIQEGRALERTRSLPPGRRAAARQAFDAGYAAGAQDVFGGFDGGWVFDAPYLVTIARAAGPVTYRIDSRLPLRLGVSYYRCGRGVCSERRRP
jgi:hypothetical protein